MLYVFHVDNGCMMTFDMSLAVESVTHLRQQVELVCKIPAEKQVLLVSGGQSLDPNARVCSYSSGTDTNPIFLFSKTVIESTVPPVPSAEYSPDLDFKEKIRELRDLPPTYSTVEQRAQMAQQFHELAKEQLKICESLVLDQHLQHQGWAAVIANLEDITAEFHKRSIIFEKNFTEYINEREPYFQFLKEFHDNLTILSKIPILPILLECESDATDTDAETSTEEATREKKMKTDDTKRALTLLEWISSVDSKSSMRNLFEQCSRGLDQFNEEVIANLHYMVEAVHEEAAKAVMKEIKGLEDRLSGLEQLMVEAKRCVQEQADLAQSFSHNKTRASNIGDASILPDLCDSHRKQLVVMSTNYEHLCDIKRRCLKAKDELSSNLNHRLKWVMFVENKMLEVDHKLVVHHESLRRLRRHLEVLQQIHLAPATYLAAVGEVVRRRAFSQAFLAWASDLACYLLAIHNDELSRRKEFQGQFDGHFLNTLFPGMEDMPPDFATQAPAAFDAHLPKLTVDDVEMLKRELPELTGAMAVPDIAAITNIFLMKSFLKSDDRVDERGIEEKLVEVVNEVGLASNLDQNLLKPANSEPCLVAHNIPHLKDLDKGCESETDTEEFEKVGQSPMELHFDKNVPRTHDAATLTELPKTMMSFSGSNTESFTNIKNPSLESIDELGSVKNFNSTTESCFNSHHQQMQSFASANFSRSKSLSPRTPQSPKEVQLSPSSPPQGHHQQGEFATDEYYIDESLPSSLSIETGQSQGEFVRQLDTANNVVALLQDNLQTSHDERERLQTILLQLTQLSAQSIEQLRAELGRWKDCVINENIHLKSEAERCSKLVLDFERYQQEAMVQVTINHESKLNELKEMNETEANRLNDEIERLKKHICEKDTVIIDITADRRRDKEGHELSVKKLENEIDRIKNERDKSMKELSDRLTHEHKAELENLRQRYKLMASTKFDSDVELDREPKDCNHEAMLMQMKENCEIEKDEAVKYAILQQERKWEAAIQEKVTAMEEYFNIEKANTLRDIQQSLGDENQKQINTFIERESHLQRECLKLKGIIQQFAESATGSSSETAQLEERIKLLLCEKRDLEDRLNEEKPVVDLTTSVGVLEGKMDAATSQAKCEPFHKNHPAYIRMLTIDTCRTGDYVLFYWDTSYKNYRILQETPVLFFLNSNSLEALGLPEKTSAERKAFYTGEVVAKEYCHARKEENRFNVPIFTKFFRVSLKPLPSVKELKKRLGFLSKDQEVQMSKSETVFEVPQSVDAGSSRESVPPTPIKQSTGDLDVSLCVSPTPEEEDEIETTTKATKIMSQSVR